MFNNELDLKMEILFRRNIVIFATDNTVYCVRMCC